MKVTLAPLDRSDVTPVLHLEIGDDQRDFVRDVGEMIDIAGPLEDFHMILKGAEVVGFFKLDRGYPEGYPFAKAGELGIRGLVVDRRAQGQGIGTAAMEALPAYARARYPQASALVLTVDSHNPGARHVYEAAGFVCDETVQYAGRCGPEIVFRMPLHGIATQG